MKNIEKYQSLLDSGEVDALLLTSEYNRLYAAQYGVAEGVAVVTKEGAYYFTDSRYIEAAEKNLPGIHGPDDASGLERYCAHQRGHWRALRSKSSALKRRDMSYANVPRVPRRTLHAVLVPMPEANRRLPRLEGAVGAGAHAQGAGDHGPHIHRSFRRSSARA